MFSRSTASPDEVSLSRKKRPTLKISPPSSPENSPLHSPHPSRNKKVWHKVHDWWLWELAGWGLATICLGTLVGILAKFQGRLLDDWPYPITLNSLLAVFSAVFKSSLLIPVAAGISQLKWARFNQRRTLIDLQRFDDASRGPVGSLMLIFRSGWLASAGTLVIITALAVEPSIQQIVSYLVQPVNSTGQAAKVSQTNDYDVYTMSASGTGGGAASPDIAPGLKASVYTGIFGNGTKVQFTCTTGNCTWPLFDSLAVCSSCVDVTQSVDISTSAAVVHSRSDNTSCNMSISISNITPPLFRPVNSLQLQYQGDEYYGVTLNMTPGTTGSVNQHNQINSSISSFTAMYFSNNYDTDCNPDHRNTLATECMLYWCVKSFSTSVNSSVFTETSSLPRSMIHNTTNGFRAFYLNENGVRYNAFEDDGIGGQGAQDFLTNTIFPAGTTYRKGGYDFGASSDFVSILSSYAFNLSDGAPSGTDGLSEIMARVADSMSAIIRTGNASSAVGTTLTQETFIHVRWSWVVLSLVLDVLTLAFLLVVIYSTHRSGTQVWKSSQMVTLFHGFSLREHMDFEEVHSLLDMEDVARSVKVQLVPDGEGMRLSKVS